MVASLLALALATPTRPPEVPHELLLPAPAPPETPGDAAPEPGPGSAELASPARAGDDDDDARLAPRGVDPEPDPVACRGRYCFDAADVLAAFTTVGPRTRCV